jgi:hypothetical protein
MTAAIAPLLGSLGIGLAVFVAAAFSQLVRWGLIYHLVVFCMFMALYATTPGGFTKHFNVPKGAKSMGFADLAYYTMVAHSTTGFGDIYPLTTYARTLVSAHLALVFLASASILPLS